MLDFSLLRMIEILNFICLNSFLIWIYVNKLKKYKELLLLLLLNNSKDTISILFHRIFKKYFI